MFCKNTCHSDPFYRHFPQCSIKVIGYQYQDPVFFKFSYIKCCSFAFHQDSRAPVDFTAGFSNTLNTTRKPISYPPSNSPSTYPFVFCRSHPPAHRPVDLRRIFSNSIQLTSLNEIEDIKDRKKIVHRCTEEFARDKSKFGLASSTRGAAFVLIMHSFGDDLYRAWKKSSQVGTELCRCFV